MDNTPNETPETPGNQSIVVDVNDAMQVAYQQIGQLQVRAALLERELARVMQERDTLLAAGNGSHTRKGGSIDTIK